MKPTVVEITATVRFKIWVDQNMIDESGSDTLTEIAEEYLSLHVNDHPDIQADIETVDNKKIVSEGSFLDEPETCPVCGAAFFEKGDIDFIERFGACKMCPVPEDEE